LREGLANLQADMEKGHLSMTDEAAFVVGRNIAVSPGSVVFENSIFQLLQYAPSTPQVHLRPLLMVPPCINKFYILDLRPDNSYIEYAVQQGFSVFVMSWRNVSSGQGHLGWDEYLADGVIKAIDVVRQITNVDRINTLGFCVGGTLLASALAILRRLGHDVVESTTFLTTFVDFSDVGDISAYVDEAFVERREREVGKGGIINGAELAFAFSSLRANELVWNYVVSNYLQGKKPPAFDLLFWNGDSTNLPGPWYCYYLRNTYLENNLVKPDKLTMCGVPLDLGYVDMPAFVFAAREDHIVPWRTAFASAGHFSGEVDFVLGASGHIAGVINPASKNKRSFWTGGSIHEAGNSAEAWFSQARENEGSWWPRWSKWLKRHSGGMIPARTGLGSETFPPTESAPGRFVKESA
jgi:polyhydroxyalkanoate synthase